MGQVELLLFAVLMLGVGLGTVASAWATRRPEMRLMASGQLIEIDTDPTPGDVAALQEMWRRTLPKPEESAPPPAPETRD